MAVRRQLPGAPPRLQPFPWALAAGLLFSTAALVACGGPEGEPGASGDDTPSVSAPASAKTSTGSEPESQSPSAVTGRAVDVDYGDLPTLFAPREARQAKGVRIHMRRADPARMGWTTEVFATAAEPVLVQFFEALAEDPEALAESLAGTGFGGLTSLVPASVDVDFEGGGVTLSRHADLDAELRGAQELPAVAAALFDRQGVGEGGRGERRLDGVDVDIVGVQPDGAYYDTRVRVQLARRGVRPLQQILQLAVRWFAEQPDKPRLVDLHLEGFEEAAATAPLFAEVSDFAFGETPHYAGHILRGVDEFLGRTDRAAGFAFQGMQGLAVGDVNGDGFDDIYVCQQVGLPNQLLLGGPDGRFRDVAPEARLDFIDISRAALILDWENDGDQDLLVAVGTWIYLCPNEGDGTFGRPTRFGTQGGAHFYNLSAADADGDGDLDFYAGRYSVGGVMRGAPAPYHDAGNGASSFFVRNDGPATMVDATEESGLAVGNTRFTLASIWDDFDQDGDQDLYVVNDFGSNNLFENDGSAHFVDVAEKSGSVDIGAGMGATVADYDLDGDMDIYVTNMWSAPGQRIVQQSERFMSGERRDLHRWYTKHASGNTLLRNRGDGSFEDVTEALGGGLGRWAWGGLFVDFDNDAYEDLYVPCGQTTKKGAVEDLEAYFWHGVISYTPFDGTPKPTYEDAFTAIHYMLLHRDYHWNGLERNVAYQNVRGERFADVSVVSATDFLGDGRAVALLDWDSDGRQDMVVKSRTAPRLRLMHNRSQSGHASVAFDLVGVECNRDAIGARVRVEVGERVLAKRLHAGDGYLSQSSKRVHFGLGDAERLGKVHVDWPDGSTDTFQGLEPGKRHRLVQGEVEVESRALDGIAVDALRIPAARPEDNTEPVVRVPLFAPLPLRPFPLPSRDEPGRLVDSFRGKDLVVQLWTASHPSGEAGLAQLARARELVAARAGDSGEDGPRFVALSVDEGPYLAKARKLAEQYGLESGYADGRTLGAFEVATFEVLDVFHDVPLPLTFLLDRAGRLSVVYVGMPFAEELARDLELLAQRTDEARVQLRGGLQVVRRKRRYSRMASVFDTQGAPQIANYFRTLAKSVRAEDE